MPCIASIRKMTFEKIPIIELHRRGAGHPLKIRKHTANRKQLINRPNCESVKLSEIQLIRLRFPKYIKTSKNRNF